MNHINCPCTPDSFKGIPVVVVPDNIKCKVPWWEVLYKWKRWEYKSMLENGQVINIMDKLYMNKATFIMIKEKFENE